MITKAVALGTTVMLAWDYAPEDEVKIDGFRVYRNDGVYLDGIDPATRDVSLAMAPGAYTLVATAYNAAGESQPSNPVSVTVVDVPPAPTNLRASS